jgi:AcrR family transcriptional regulator
MGTARHRRDRPLDPAKIVEAAVMLSKQPDRHALSARRLGEQLGVDPTAVYRHFASMDELVKAALDAIWRDAARLIPRSLPWRAKLETIGHVFFQVIVEHPAVGIDAYRLSTNGPGEEAIVDMVLSCLEQAGLSDDHVVDFYAVLSSTVISHASAQAAERIETHEVVPPDERRWIEPPPNPVLVRFPSLVRHIDGLTSLDQPRVFELSLSVVLDAIESLTATAT